MSEDDLATVALLEFLNRCEEGIASAKHLIIEAKLNSAPIPSTWSPDKVKWTKAEGASGLYERSEDVDSLDFKAMLKHLTAHKGKLHRDGLFYWLFRNGYTVGRKPQKKQEPKP